MLEVETAKDILKEGMEAEWDAFQKFADDVKKSVKVENPVVVVYIWIRTERRSILKPSLQK